MGDQSAILVRQQATKDRFPRPLVVDTRHVNQLAARLSGATKTFGTHTAVSEFDLEIPKGSIYGLLGPDGSGKTTTIRMIMGILLPDHGSVELFGGVPDFARRSRVGYLPEERGVYEKMKVVDQLVFLGRSGA